MGKFFNLAVLLYGCTVLCCEEGIQHSIKGTKCQFAECRNGRWFLINCRSDLSSNSKNQSLATVCEENDFYSHYSENRAYYKCEQGRLVLKLCGEEEIFDAERKMCREIVSKKTESGNNISAKDNTIIKETKKNCTNGEKRKLEGSCKHYYVCKNGNEVLSHCSPCQNYNEKEKKCRYVFQTPCHTKTKPIPEPEITTCSPTETSPPAPHIPSSEITPQSTTPEANDPTPENLTTTESSTEHNKPSLITSPSPESPQTVVTVTQQPDSITGEYDTSNKSSTNTPTTDANDDTSNKSSTNTPTTDANDDTSNKSSTNTPTTDANDDPSITGTPSSQIIPSSPTNPPMTEAPKPTPHPVTSPSDSITESLITSTLPPSECVYRTALSDCKSYMECHEGELVPRKCDWLQHFDSKTLECKYIGYSCYENKKAI